MMREMTWMRSDAIRAGDMPAFLMYDMADYCKVCQGKLMVRDTAIYLAGVLSGEGDVNF